MWTRVCKVSELPPGSAKAVTIEGKAVALYNVAGKFYALDGVCPHRGGPLGEGHLDGNEVTCPWHAWTFDVTTGKCTALPDFDQPVFPVKVEGDEIFIEV